MNKKQPKIALVTTLFTLCLSLGLTSINLLIYSVEGASPLSDGQAQMFQEKCEPICMSNSYAMRNLRLAIVGDIDSNSGLNKLLKLAHDYNVQVLIVPGDYAYSNGKEVLSKLESFGFTNENSNVAVGNHDSTQEVKDWLGSGNTLEKIEFSFTEGKLALFNVNTNMDFDCSSDQYSELKEQIESSDAWYKFAVVHEPFVTVKSKHPPNGEFDCYDSMFRKGGIDGVLQAHNHNYQRFNIDGLLYGVYGTGTHDSGSDMYPLKSDSWEGNDCIKCITEENGITIIDLQIENPRAKNFQGWFVNMDNKILDKFEDKSISST